MSQEIQSPFAKRTIASDNLVRSETKDSRVLLLASKKHLQELSPNKKEEPQKLITEDKKQDKKEVNLTMKRRFTEYQRERENISANITNDLSTLKSLYTKYLDDLSWKEQFLNFIKEKNNVQIEDMIPKPINSEGEILLCYTEIWVLFIQYHYENVFQKSNLQRVVNLFNESLKYDLSDYDLIYRYFNEIISKFPKSLILTHISLNDKYKHKCPKSADDIELIHYKFLLDHPEFMLEGQLNQTFESKKMFEPTSSKRMSISEKYKESSSPKKYRGSYLSSSRRLDFNRGFSQFENVDNKERQLTGSKTKENSVKLSNEKQVNINSNQSKQIENKLNNSNVTNKTLNGKSHMTIDNPHMLSEREIALNVTSFYGTGTDLVDNKSNTSQKKSNNIKDFKENFFKQFNFNTEKKESNINETKRNPDETQSVSEGEEGSIKGKLRRIKELNNKTIKLGSTVIKNKKIMNENENGERMDINNQRKNNILNFECSDKDEHEHDGQEECDFTFSKDRNPNDISLVSYNVTHTPVNTPFKNDNTSFSLLKEINFNTIQKFPNNFTISSDPLKQESNENLDKNRDELKNQTEIASLENKERNLIELNRNFIIQSNKDPNENRISIKDNENSNTKVEYINTSTNENINNNSLRSQYQTNKLSFSKENNIHICKFIDQESQTHKEILSFEKNMDIIYPSIHLRMFKHPTLRFNTENNFNMIHEKIPKFEKDIQTETKEYKEAFTEIILLKNDQTTTTHDLNRKADHSTDTHDLSNKIDQTTDTNDLPKKNDQTTDTDDLPKWHSLAEAKLEDVPLESNYYKQNKFEREEEIYNKNINLHDDNNRENRIPEEDKNSNEEMNITKRRTSHLKSTKRKLVNKLDDEYKPEEEVNVIANKKYKEKLRSSNKFSESDVIDKKSIEIRINNEEEENDEERYKRRESKGTLKTSKRSTGLSKLRKKK